jgi:hypothetical protein
VGFIVTQRVCGRILFQLEGKTLININTDFIIRVVYIRVETYRIIFGTGDNIFCAYENIVKLSESSEFGHFRVTITTNCRALTHCM